MDGSISFGKVSFECVSGTGAGVSWATGEEASFGSRSSFGDDFLDVPGEDLSGLFNFRLFGGRGEVGDFDFSFIAILASSVTGLFLFASFASELSMLFLEAVPSGDLAKLLRTARGVTMAEGDVRFRAFVGVEGGGCGGSTFSIGSPGPG